MKYPIVIRKDSDSDYSVEIPDLPGCFSAGSTVEEAMDMAKEAAECHIEGLLIDSEPVPPASDIEAHRGNADYEDCILAAVEVRISDL
jgi:predicted RNase H-like HicB family nuclease